VGETRSAYVFLERGPCGIQTFGKLERRWDDNVKLHLKEIDYQDVNWIEVA
jgi:hypothetical protein